MLAKLKSYFYLVSWNTLSHLNMIGLTCSRHTQVIVEVNAPFTSLCGYLTDINIGGVVRQPLSFPYFPLPFLACSVQGPDPYLFSLAPHEPPHPPPPIVSPSTLALRIIAQCVREGVWTLRSICGHTWGWKGKIAKIVNR